MSFARNFFSPFVCCFGHSKPDEPAPSDLQTLPSALNLPASHIPHGVGHPGSLPTDAEALHELFRTTSSVRGYQTASIPSASYVRRESSFDVDFRLGSSESPRKPLGRLEQLGNHIKQKLSESGMSRGSTRPHAAIKESDETSLKRDNLDAEMRAAKANLSPRSTGLVNLLQSRTASDGGYDSDAKSIPTAMLRSREGTLEPSPARAPWLPSPSTNLLIAADGAISPPEVGKLSEDGHSLRMRCYPAPATSNQSLAQSDRCGKGWPLTSQPSHSCPSDSAADHNLTMEPHPNPDQPFAALETKEDDPFSVISSPTNLDQANQLSSTFVEALGKFKNALPEPKRESMVSNATNTRTSLISNLDPSVLGFISRNNEVNSAGFARGSLHRRPLPPTVDSKRTSSSACSELPKSITFSSNITSASQSDRSVIHLNSMRISQRLASPSFVTASSRPNTSHATTSLAREGSSTGQFFQTRSSTSGNVASGIAVEHNRRPSDPHTRRLFEDDMTALRPFHPWKDGRSQEASTVRFSRNPTVGSDDASSFYWSDYEVDSNRQASQYAAKRNPNSIAIGGRSESISLPIGSISGNPSLGEEGVWFSKRSPQHKRETESFSPLTRSTARHRSISMPDDVTETLDADDFARIARVQHSTAANEEFSPVVADSTKDGLRGALLADREQTARVLRSERMTEISTEGLHVSRNEGMSEIGWTMPEIQLITDPPSSSFWPNIEPRTPLSKSCAAERRSASDCVGSSTALVLQEPGLLESTTNIWRGSFRRAMKEPQEVSWGGLLATPKFDRKGRRRGSKSSARETQASPNHGKCAADLEELQTELAVEPWLTRQKSLLDICTEKPETLSAVGPIPKDTTPMQKHTSSTFGPPRATRKRSLLDFGRRFSTLGSSTDADGSMGAVTPLEDFLGSWGRFPSHTKEERCASAGVKDGVAARDFSHQCGGLDAIAHATDQVHSSTPNEQHEPGGWKLLPFAKKDRLLRIKAKSTSPFSTLKSPFSITKRTNKSRKKMAERLQRLYRTSSMEFQAYNRSFGHRSSVSLGGRVEYPELEVVGGSPGWASNMDGTADHQRGAADVHSRMDQPLDTASWTQTYDECVGSMSALKSDPELREKSLETGAELDHHRLLGFDNCSSINLRESTLNFGSQLGKENAAARESLMNKVQSMQAIE
jgi:hypothetical protein